VGEPGNVDVTRAGAAGGLERRRIRVEGEDLVISLSAGELWLVVMRWNLAQDQSAFSG
jgi:hypothetical protein